jgi:hypothetical protein
MRIVRKGQRWQRAALLVGKCSPDPVSHGVVICAMFAADASDERIRPTRDRAAA